MAAGSVRIDWQGKAAVLTLDHAPSNALTAPVRGALLSAILSVQSAEVIVICGAGAGFSSALPLDPDPGLPGLAAVCAAVAGSIPPVVAALHGLVMGPGAELALAATARVAAPGTRLVLPNVALGLCPEGGTTRRLPVLVGPEAALDLMISGRAVGLDEALALGLVDARAEPAPVAAALGLADRLGALPPRPARDPAVWASVLARARRAHAQALPAVGRIIACVEAAHLLPPDAAQAFETVAREDLETSPEAQGLRSAARAERRAAVLPAGVAQGAAVDRIGLIGQAPALIVLAEAALAQGLAVEWAVPGTDAQAAVITAVDTALAARQRRGGLGPASRQAALARLAVRDALSAPCPLTVATAPLADATGTVLLLDGGLGELGLGIAPSGRASELALPAEDGVAGVAVAVATLRRIGLPPVLVSGRPVLGARVVRAGEGALRWMVAQGVSPAAVSGAVERFGAAPPALGPAGTDGRAARQMAAEDILRRWLAALANEGLRLVEAGIARHGSDIDHVLVAGHGFPRWQGGPMHQADRRGLMVLRHDLRLWAEEDAIWHPAPLLDRLIGRGLRLSALDG